MPSTGKLALFLSRLSYGSGARNMDFGALAFLPIMRCPRRNSLGRSRADVIPTAKLAASIDQISRPTLFIRRRRRLPARSAPRRSLR